MKVEADNTISLSIDEVTELCKPGEGNSTCIWLVVGTHFECCYFKRPTSLASRWEQGLTVAKRDGCGRVKSLGLEVKYTESISLADMYTKGQ